MVREDVPLAERLRYVCIVSSILDEFFEVRMSDLIDEMIESGGWGPAAPQWESFVRVSERAHALVERQYRLFNEVITPALAKRRIVILGSHNLTQSALRHNNELSVRIDSPSLAAEVGAYQDRL